MTASYQLARRPPKRYTEWESYAINGGICPTGFDTYFYGQHDWKICVPNPHPSTTLNNCRGPSSFNSKREDYSCCGKKVCSNNSQTKPTCIERGCPTWQNGSSNEWAHGCPTPKSGWRTSRATLYDDRDTPDGWLYNTIPYQMRRQLHEPRAEFDRYGYYQLPTRYNGTGYDVLRGWKRPQYSLDMVDVPPVWNPNVLQQPYPVQQQTKQSEEEGFETLTTNDNRGVMGGFYSDPVKMKEYASLEQTNNCFCPSSVGGGRDVLWDYNQTGSVPNLNN